MVILFSGCRDSLRVNLSSPPDPPVENEVSNTFSLELAVRYDHVVVGGSTEALTGGLLGALGGGTFYF